MSKNLIQDIKIKRRPTQKREVILHSLDLNFKEEKNTTPRYKLWFIASFSIIFLLISLSLFFAKATVTVSPKTQELNLDQTFSANKDNNSSSLSFDLVVISGEENKSIVGGILKNIENKATGQVIIYNNYSTGSQTLVKNSSLEGSNGKIYKTLTKVVVPGMSKGVAGKIEVSIYSASSGEEYNSTPLDFKLSIFKGTAKYTKFYARSKGDIIGGLSGKFYEISEEEKIKTTGELENNLKNKLSEKIINQIPPGFILFKDAVFLNTNKDSLNTTSAADSKDKMVSITLKGTLYGFLFNEKKLTKNITETAIDQYDGSGVHIPNIKDFKFSLVDQNVSFADVDKLNFKLSGVSKIVWDIDSSQLIASLLGKSKKEFSEILLGYKNLDSASLKIRPPWKLSMPDKSKNIEIIINEPK